MTDDQAHRFAEWQDGLTVDILERSIPAITDDLADWYCRNHRPALDPESFPEELRAALLRRICACCGERIHAGRGFDTRAGDLKACGPTCCDRINEARGIHERVRTMAGVTPKRTLPPCVMQTPQAAIGALDADNEKVDLCLSHQN